MIKDWKGENSRFYFDNTIPCVKKCQEREYLQCYLLTILFNRMLKVLKHILSHGLVLQQRVVA